MPETSDNTLRRLPRFKPRGGLQVMYASIRALFLRELQTRFGHYRLGYLWAFLEPALSVVFMLIVFGAIMKRTMPGIDYTVFLINGILPFFAFRKSGMQALSALTSNKGLFSYRSVRPIDAVLARTFLEVMLYFTCYIILTILFIWIGYTISFSYIPSVLFYWVCLFVFTLGVSCILMVAGAFSPEVNKFISPIFLVLYFMSGALFPLHRIPEDYLIYFMWNPLAHLFELMRHAVSPEYNVVTGTSLSYILICLIVLIFLGLLLVKAFSNRMLKSR